MGKRIVFAFCVIWMLRVSGQSAYPNPAWDSLTLDFPSKAQSGSHLYRSPEGFLWGVSGQSLFRLCGRFCTSIPIPAPEKVTGMASMGYSQILISTDSKIYSWNGADSKLKILPLDSHRFRIIEGFDRKPWLMDSTGLFPYSGEQSYIIPAILIRNAQLFSFSISTSQYLYIAIDQQLIAFHRLFPNDPKIHYLEGNITGIAAVRDSGLMVMTHKRFYFLHHSNQVYSYKKKKYENPIPYITRNQTGWILYPKKRGIICNPKGEAVQEIPSYIPIPEKWDAIYTDEWKNTWILHSNHLLRICGEYSFFFPRNMKPQKRIRSQFSDSLPFHVAAAFRYHPTYKGPPAEKVNGLVKDNFGHPWFYGPQGLWKGIKDKGEIAEHIPIPGGVVYAILDEKGNLWGMGSKGVFLYQIIVQRLTLFSSQCGININSLQNMNADTLGILLHSRDQVFRIFYNRIQHFPEAEPVLITGIMVNKIRIPLSSHLPIFNKGDKVALRFHLSGPGFQRSFDFLFTGRQHATRDENWNRSDDGWIYIPEMNEKSSRFTIRYRDWFGRFHQYIPALSSDLRVSTHIPWLIPLIFLFLMMFWIFLLRSYRPKFPS